MNLLIPKKQSDILVKNYLKYNEFVKSLTDIDKEDKVLLLKNTVMIFYEIDSIAFDGLPYTVVMDLYQIIENLLKLEAKLVPRFMFDNIEYGINPDFTSMTLAELVDLDSEDVMRQICILYRPITKRRGKLYDIKKYEANIEIYDRFQESLTLDIYLGFMSFFLSINKDLLNYTLKYLTEKDINQEKTKVLVASGVGTVGSTS